MMATDTLRKAARRYGIRTWYRDIWGRVREPSPETLKALLEALGPTKETTRGTELPIRPWIVVCQDEVSHELVLRTNQPSRGRGSGGLPRAWVQIRSEQGGVLYEGEIKGDESARLRVLLPERLPLGYHVVRVAVEGSGTLREGEARLVCCPARCYRPGLLEGGGRQWGLGVGLHCLSSDRNWGAGDFKDLEELALWSSRELGAGFIGLLPIHYVANRQPYNISPYFPSSRLYRNPLVLDIESIPEFSRCEAARRLASCATLRSLREGEFVDIPAVAQLKMRALKALFEAFLEGEGAEGRESTRGNRFREYLIREGEPLLFFATFLALEERFLGQDPPLWTWRQWPTQYRDPRSDAVKDFQRASHKAIMFYQWVQWLIYEQLLVVHRRARDTGMPIGLLQDMALGVDPCGADAWAYPGVYVRGVTVGAPPDEFSPLGQNWGIPPMNPFYLKHEGFGPWVRLLQKNLVGAGALRLDHAMGIFRLFWIPDGGSPRDGTYVEYPARELLLLLALESHRHGVVVVGEDLGTVEPRVRRGLRKAGVLSTRLLYFQKDKRGGFLHPSRYPRQAMVSITTHDLPTMVGFWEGRDIRWRMKLGLFPDREAADRANEERKEARKALLGRLKRLGLVPASIAVETDQTVAWTEELQRAVIHMLAATPCMLILVGLEELGFEKEQLNLPGTLQEYPNWRRRARLSVDSVKQPETMARLKRVLNGLLRRGTCSSEGHS